MDTEDEYTEIVLTFNADFSDPDLHLQLVNLSGQLQQHLSGNKNVTVTKVEPWNSVRVTLSISKDAALNLQRLAEKDGQLLRDLGILSVQLHGNQSIYVDESRRNAVASETLESHRNTVASGTLESRRNAVATETLANRLTETSGNEMRVPCSSEPHDAVHAQRLFAGNSSRQSFPGFQERNNVPMPQDCFPDGTRPLEQFVYPPRIQDVPGYAYFGSPRSQWYTDNPDASFNFPNDRLAFHQVSRGAFDDVTGTRSVGRFSSSDSQQFNERGFLRGRRHVQSNGVALRSDRSMPVDHVRQRHRFPAPNPDCTQNYGRIDIGTGVGNYETLFHRRQWRGPRPRSSAAQQRRPFREETMQRLADNDSVMRRRTTSDPWLRGLGQESKEIYSGFRNSHQMSLSSESSCIAARPVIENPIFARQNSFRNTQHSAATDRNFLNDQINSARSNRLAKSQASNSCQTPFHLRSNLNPDPGRRRVSSNNQNSVTVQSDSCGMALPEVVHSPGMSAFSPASPDNLSHLEEDGVFCHSATVLAAESSKLAVERALSLLSDTTDDASSLPMEKERYHSSDFGAHSSLPTGPSRQGILGKFQAFSQKSNCFTAKTQPITSIAANQSQSFNRVVESRQKSPSALKKASRSAESPRRNMFRANDASDDLNYFFGTESKTYDRANGYGCKSTAPTFSNVASGARLDVARRNSAGSRSGSDYPKGNGESGVSFRPDGNGNNISRGLSSSFAYAAMSSPIQQEMLKVSRNPLMLPSDRFPLSSKSSKYNFTQPSLSMGSCLSPSSSLFPPTVRDALVRFSCRVQSQDKLQTTPEGGSSSSPRDTCSWMESDLCSSIPDSGIASNTSSGGSSDLSELERTLGGSLENFSKYQEAADAKDGCMPDAAAEEGTDGAWQTHSIVSHVQNTNGAGSTSHEFPSSVSRHAASPGRAVGFGSAESYAGVRSESMTSAVQQKHGKGVSFEQCNETLKNKAPGPLEGSQGSLSKNDSSVHMHTTSKVSSMKTDSDVVDACQQTSRVKLRLSRNSSGTISNGEPSSSSRSCFEPLITCPSLPHRLSESVKLAMQGVSPVGGTSTDTFSTTRGMTSSAGAVVAPAEAMQQASTIIRITKTKSGDIHSKQKDTWCIQPVIRHRPEKQQDEKTTTTSSANRETPPKPSAPEENVNSPTADPVTLLSNDFKRSSQNRNKLCTARLKPGRGSTFANSLRTKKFETSRPLGADRHKSWLKGGQSGELKQFACSGSRLLAERTVLNCGRTRAKRLNCVQMRNVDG